MGALLEARGLTKRFGGVLAVDGLDLDVMPDRLTGLIGPNGAGKTTVFGLLSRAISQDAGRLAYRGVDYSAAPPHAVARMGVGRTFQNIRLFPSLSVLENVMVGHHARSRAGLWAGLFGGSPERRERRAAREAALRWLDFVGLAHRTAANPLSLPYGEQKRVEIARALVAEPELLLLDEPAGGLNEEERASLGEHLQAILRLGKAILLIEHDMAMVMRFCDWIVVLDQGRKIAEGPPAEVRRDPGVVAAYLGA